MLRHVLAAFAAFSVTAPLAVSADEGMWTLDRFPTAKVAKAYGFTATPAFLEHIRKSAVRLPGCSGSFVGRDGLVMTNHHCARGCIGNISDPQHDYVSNGFTAATLADEKACPGFQIVSLLKIDDITKSVMAATAGRTGAAFAAARRAVNARLESTCQAGHPELQCQVVSLYHGGLYNLYTYRKYNDVRLVFAPDEATAFFGGDPDNFTFPRYDLDCSFLRVYDNGKPLTSPDFFPWSPAGTKEGQLVFVPGNPGSTSRLLTVAQLQHLRDATLPRGLRLSSETRGLLTQYASESPEHTRQALNNLFGVENGLKGNWGREGQLTDPAFFAAKVREEKAERAAIDANPALKAKYGGAWDAIARIVALEAKYELPFSFREAAGAPGTYLGNARTLVRAAAEKAKPNGERLREFQDAALPQVEQRLRAPIPVYPELEKATLTHSLTKIREWLGPDDPYVRALLGNDSPEAVAARVVGGSQLGDPKVRMALYTGGAAAVATSTDPAIVLMRSVDPISRQIRKTWEDEVDAPLTRESERVAQAGFALYGLKTYPDATFTLRVSYGAVKGYDLPAGHVAPYTTLGGAFTHATGSYPFALPKSWYDAKPALKLDTPYNFVNTTDIIGGNSGSPVVDQNGRIVGLIFDGNIQSLGGDYLYDGRQNRAVAVDSRGMLEVLRTVYHADRLAAELSAK